MRHMADKHNWIKYYDLWMTKPQVEIFEDVSKEYQVKEASIRYKGAILLNSPLLHFIIGNHV